MNLGSLLFSRRVRQNHALEHATITILSGMISNLSISAHSSADGFVIFGDVDLGLLRRAMDEALRRLQAGEAELAIHPDCDINMAVGMSLITLGAFFSLASNGKRTRIVAAAVSCMAGLMAAGSVGNYIQRHFATLSDLTDVRVTEIARRKFFGFTFMEVRTAGKVHLEHDVM
jgi:RecA/RadA recombinase